MPSVTQKLDMLRMRKLGEMAQLEQDKQAIQSKINEVGFELRGIESAIKTVCNGVADEEDTTPHLNGGKYAGVSLTPAVLDVIATHGDPPGLLAGEIIEKLNAEGFKSAAKDLFPTIYGAALRLVKSGQIGEGRRDNKRTFMRK